jgi:hypothetical protein
VPSENNAGVLISAVASDARLISRLFVQRDGLMVCMMAMIDWINLIRWERVNSF